MKKLNVSMGLIFSATSAVLAGMPMFIGFDTAGLPAFLRVVVYFFSFIFSLWICLQALAGYQFFRRKKSRFVYFLLSAAIVIIVTLTFDFINNHLLFTPVLLFRYMDADRIFPMTIFRGFIMGMFESFFIFYLDVQKEKQEKILEIEHLKQSQLQVRLSSLKEQLSPHFLFNTLNTLSIITSEKTVKDFTNELANVYRYVLQNKDKDSTAVEEELAFIHSYLYIIKARLEDAIGINIQVEEQYLQRKIPPLTLQLLLENAIKHNVAAAFKPLYIHISVIENKYLAVENNYQPKKTVQDSFGVGLTNIMERYRLLYREDIVIEQTRDKFRVKLPLV